MIDEHLRTLRFLLARLERISADSVVAHRASGVRGAMLRMVDQFERQEQVCPDAQGADRRVSAYEAKQLIDAGYILLRKAAEEKVR